MCVLFMHNILQQACESIYTQLIILTSSDMYYSAWVVVSNQIHSLELNVTILILNYFTSSESFWFC